jgi:hypothetical protein
MSMNRNIVLLFIKQEKNVDGGDDDDDDYDYDGDGV